MLQRISCVDNIGIKIVAFSSTLQLGDSKIINGFSRALAVQREAESDFGYEGSFNYPVFSETIPLPPLSEKLSYHFHHLNPVIKVKNIHAIGVSAASLVHIGSSRNISMEVRVKHIRQLLPRSNAQTETARISYA